MAKVWADQPFKLVPVPGEPGVPKSEKPGLAYVTWDMANVHNNFIRSLNAIYLQCENVHEAQDIKDFVFYIKCWQDSVHHHHHGEEADLFPKVDVLANEAGIEGSPMNANVEQHRKFDAGLQRLGEYVTEVQAGNKTYDGKELKALLDDFAQVLVDHLHEEMPTLLGLEQCDDKKLKKTWEDYVARSVKSADPFTVVPMALSSCDKSSPGGKDFPIVPWFLPYLSAFVFSKKHKGSWRFSPSDAWGKPQALKFLAPGQS